jgi:hypothetical protein
VNHAPSFNTDTPLDASLKRTLLIDTFKLLGITVEEKSRKLANLKLEKQKRMIEKGNLKRSL